MVTVTSGPETWLLSETRRTSVQTTVPTGVRASSSKKHSARRPLERDSFGRFITAGVASARPAAAKIVTSTPGARGPSRRSLTTASDGATKSVELGYLPFPKQQQFHESSAKYRLFGGAAGPGKSKALLMEAILQAHETPGAQTLLLRRTFPELEQSLLFYFRRDVPRELYRSFNESKHVVEWLNGSTTRFGYCQNESDVYQYQGSEFLFIGIDELTLFTLRQRQFLTSRNRCPVPGSFPCMAAATNPGNIGHAWVKSLWIDHQAASGMENPDAYDPADYDFIPARVSDNPIYAGDEQYLKTLRALPSHLRRAFLDGDWDVFAGQYFDKFDTSRHVARAEQIDWKPWWPRWISIDWGFEHPFAAYWHTEAPATSNVAQVFGPEASASASAASYSGATAECGGLPPPCSATTSSDANTQTSQAAPQAGGSKLPHSTSTPGSPRVVTYREFVTHRTPPRELARQIIERSLHSDAAPDDAFAGASAAADCADADACLDAVHSATSPPQKRRHSEERSDEESLFVSTGCHRSKSKRDPSSSINLTPQDYGVRDRGTKREHIDAIYLSPDAFARRTDEASIADQMGDVFVAAGFPRPIPADNDRVGGWMLMYQMLESGEWLLTDNCIELIRTLPNLVRDPARIEDVEKMDGDDPADAARYGLKSRYGARHGGGSGRRMPLAARLAERVTSADPTVRAIQARKAQLEESRRPHPVSFLHRRQ